VLEPGEEFPVLLGRGKKLGQGNLVFVREADRIVCHDGSSSHQYGAGCVAGTLL
jgi:hypothetical protein